ncbi:MAG: bifunctional 4-hydroxy-2-oxoglutarate aldolase/2-dehydro-3-deoxy-phosphogluconate aldolase [Lachnospiraceae bacterium]|nr:bifunctional 4-hydroxy-2-oxoglutarate aldolase/2-dehydro-3-deoxy-phosphogluconate aldolase [Lachnospiraceae bacterium]
MYKIFDQLRDIGIVPVVSISDTSKAIPMAEALLEGGIACVEITCRTAEAKECLRLITHRFPEMLAGAGTVLTTIQADEVYTAGAQFVVSPGFNPQVVSHCLKKEIPIIPGCVTPTEMEAAMAMGLDVVKFFPAEQAGGLPYIKAVSAPYPNLQFLPTGGISAANLGEYIAFPRVIACGGSFMVTKELLDAGNFAQISALSQEAVAIVKAQRG